MNEKFNLYFDMSDSSGGSMLSRHLNRDQARQVIRENIINNYLLYRNDGGISPDILKDIVTIESTVVITTYSPARSASASMLCAMG